jgi:hypothetical protein
VIFFRFLLNIRNEMGFRVFAASVLSASSGYSPQNYTSIFIFLIYTFILLLLLFWRIRLKYR